ncbi:MAG: OB-fold domain-containing protein [Acidimicrobiia bacterium]
MESGMLLPDVDDPDSAEFWQGCARGELLVQACGSCGRRRMPPRPMCPACRSTEVAWERMSGRATVWSFVVTHPPLLPAYAEMAPYNVVVVALDDDPSIRFVGNIVESPTARLDSIDPASVRIGEHVEVVFAEFDGVTLPRWVRV